MLEAWTSFDSDRGGVLWGIACCWLAVLSNLALLAFAVPIAYVVPWTLFGVPLLVTLLIAAARRVVGGKSPR